jgi:hypothetical protein
MPYEWRSPLWTWFEYPNTRAHDENFKFVVAFPTTEPDSILRVAAQSGFWDIGVEALRKFQAELFIDAGDADDKRKLFPVLMSLVTGILQCSADEALAIISARLGHMGFCVGTDELLNVDEGLELVERHEREVIKQEKSTLLNEQDNFDQLLADLVKFQKTRVGAARASHVVQQPLPAVSRTSSGTHRLARPVGKTIARKVGAGISRPSKEQVPLGTDTGRSASACCGCSACFGGSICTSKASTSRRALSENSSPRHGRAMAWPLQPPHCRPSRKLVEVAAVRQLHAGQRTPCPRIHQQNSAAGGERQAPMPELPRAR